MRTKSYKIYLFTMLLFAVLLSACSSVSSPPKNSVSTTPDTKDREAILAMAGNYKVTFDFTETVSFVQNYEKKSPYQTGALEVVRVIKDKPGFISLQHILVVGEKQNYPIKHWRQDWIFEPEFIMEFVGFNGWKKRKLSENERQGKWAQVVYQVDDSPRYAAFAAWQHENGISQWESPANLRPLPRRDMTKRDDYDAILAVNRHAITPAGWVHEQDNSKLILRNGLPELLVREIGVNTYVQDDTFAFNIAEQYWQKTKNYWQAVRNIWTQLELSNNSFALTLQGEPTELYMPLLEYAGYVGENKMPLQEAIAKAQETIHKFTTTKLTTKQITTASTVASR